MNRTVFIVPFIALFGLGACGSPGDEPGADPPTASVTRALRPTGAVDARPYFKLQYYHAVYNPNGPNSSANCGPASLAMILKSGGLEPANLTVETSIDRARALMFPADRRITTREGVRVLDADQEYSSDGNIRDGASGAGATSAAGSGWAALDLALDQGKPVVAYGFLNNAWRAQFPQRVGSGTVGHINAILGRTSAGLYIVLDPMHEGGPVELRQDQLKVFFQATSGGVPSFRAITLPRASLGVQYQAHVQNIGWQAPQANGGVAGTVGQGLRLEALNVSLQRPAGSTVDVCYEAHVQNIGWQGQRCNAQTAGTVGQGLRIEALRLRLVTPPPGLRVCYQANVQGLGWQPEVCDWQVAGTTGQNLRLEAIKVRLVP